MLVFIVSIYKREALTKIFLDYYRPLKEKYGFEIVVAGSEGEKSKALSHGFDYIETKNFPLSQKNNAMMRRARHHNPKAVVLLGSDDFISESLIQYYYKLIKAKEKRVISFYDLYFYDVKENLLTHFDCGENSYGAGRFFPRNVLDKIMWTGWVGSYDRGLDRNNARNMISFGIETKLVRLSEAGGVLVDVKHEFNITDKKVVKFGKPIKKELIKSYNIPFKKIDILC